MKKILQNAFLFLLIGAVFMSLMQTRRGQPLMSGQVVAINVDDGDTIRIIINHRKETVRLLGIDCPETAQKYGHDATRYTREFLKLAPGKRVPVKLEFDVRMRDRYNRLLAYVYDNEGNMINEALVREGYAVPLNINPNNRYKDKFDRLVQEAKKNKKNIWDPKDPLTETPSEFRRKNR